MTVTKKHFIALADAIKDHNKQFDQHGDGFNDKYLETLADFCSAQNPNFNRERWLGYIAGTNGKNGGKR